MTGPAVQKGLGALKTALTHYGFEIVADPFSVKSLIGEGVASEFRHRFFSRDSAAGCKMTTPGVTPAWEQSHAPRSR